MEPQPKVDPIGHKDRKKGLGVGHNHPRAYRRDAGYSIYLGFFVLFVAINASRPASIFGASNTEAGRRARRAGFGVADSEGCIRAHPQRQGRCLTLLLEAREQQVDLATHGRLFGRRSVL